MKEFLKNILTEANNQTFGMAQLVGGASALSLCGGFIYTGCKDLQGFGVAAAAIIAALAAKHVSETYK